MSQCKQYTWWGLVVATDALRRSLMKTFSTLLAHLCENIERVNISQFVSLLSSLLSWWIYLRKNTFTFPAHSQHWYGTGIWNASLWKTRFYCKIYMMVVDDKTHIMVKLRSHFPNCFPFDYHAKIPTKFTNILIHKSNATWHQQSALDD